MTQIDIAGGFYQSSSLPLSAQNAVNMYPYVPQVQGALSQKALFFTPGIELFAELSGPGRGAINFSGEFYTVNGTRLYRVTESGDIFDLGEIRGEGRVSIDQNGLAICIIVPGETGYFYDPEAGLYEIQHPVFVDFTNQEGGVTSVCSIGGYFVFTTAFEFFLSSLTVDQRGQGFSALDFGTAELKPDNNVRCFVVRNELYIAGTETIQIFRNTGGADFPFTFIQGGTIDKGLRARFSLVEFDNGFFFLGDYINEAPAIWQVRGGTAKKVSTPAIDNAIQSYTNEEQESVFANAYTEEGGYFIAFSFPDRTFVFDLVTGVWHERSSDGGRWCVSTLTRAYGREIATDCTRGSVGILDRNNLLEYGELIDRSFTSAYVFNEAKSFKIRLVQLQTESGVGLAPVRRVSRDPVIKLEFSDDGGRTFKNSGDRRLGRQGETATLQRWYRQGRAENSRVFRFSIREAVRVNILRLDIYAQGASNG